MGRSHGRLTIKIHALVDDLVMFGRFSLTVGKEADTNQALSLLGELKSLSLDEDKAYDTNAILQALKSLSIQAVIASKSNFLELVDN